MIAVLYSSTTCLLALASFSFLDVEDTNTSFKRCCSSSGETLMLAARMSVSSNPVIKDWVPHNYYKREWRKHQFHGLLTDAWPNRGLVGNISSRRCHLFLYNIHIKKKCRAYNA